MSKLEKIKSKIDNLHKKQKRLKVQIKELEEKFKKRELDEDKYRKKMMKVDQTLESTLSKLKELNREKKELLD